MHSMIDAALNRNRTILLLLLLIFVAGTNAYINIPKESSPDIQIPIIYVSMTHDGISPEDSERLLLRPMEQELRVIEGIDEMRGNGYLGGGNVILEFDAGFNVDKALDDVRQAVDLARPDLPEETDEPVVKEVSFSDFPVITVILSGNVSQRTLVNLSRDLQDELESLPNVLEARIVGDREEVVEIVIDPLKLESYQLETTDIINFVQRSNQLVAAGVMDTGQGRFAIKVPGLFENPKDIMNMPIVARDEGTVLVKDIASVRPTFKDSEGYAHLDGEPAVALEITKRTGRNIIETIEDVKALVTSQSTLWPKAVQIAYIQDQSIQIRDMLRDLQNNVISAVLLVMIVVVAILGLKSGLLVGIAVPGSFLLGILTLSVMGLTVNVVVLFSLILAVGMLVDGAIVVTEYADRKLNEGLPPVKAYGMAAKRMSWPIATSTATTLAAFFPLLFWPDIVGEFMKYMPITLLATLTASLLMALIFIPTIGSIIAKRREATRSETPADDGDIEIAMTLDSIDGFTKKYVNFLRKMLSRPGLILLATFFGLIGTQVLYQNFGKGVEFFPDVEPDFASLVVHARGNLSIDEMDDLIKRVEQRVLDMPEFESVYSATGNQAQANQDGAEDIIGLVNFSFVDWDKRRSASEILAEAQERTSDIGGIHIETKKAEEGPQQGKDIQIQISSRNTELLPATTAQIRSLVESIEGLMNIEDTLPVPGIEWQLDINREQAAKFGVDTSMVGQAIRMLTNGVIIDTFRPEGARDEVDIIVRFPKGERGIEQLDKIRITGRDGNIPISTFVTREARQRVSKIDRVDSQRIMKVEADAQPGVLVDDKVKELRAKLSTFDLPEGVNIEFRGQNEDQEKSSAFLKSAFSLALFIIAIILVTQFNSIYLAFLILSAIIMSTIGVFLGLLITGQPFGIVMGGVGVIALAGIVVNNNIVLIDTYQILAKRYDDPMEAILLTGAQRLRPVLMTTVTTILGLLPMVLRTNIDFVTREISVGAPSTQWWSQLATSITFGLAFATILTLVVTPSALMFKFTFQEWLGRRKHAIKRKLPVRN